MSRNKGNPDEKIPPSLVKGVPHGPHIKSRSCTLPASHKRLPFDSFISASLKRPIKPQPTPSTSASLTPVFLPLPIWYFSFAACVYKYYLKYPNAISQKRHSHGTSGGLDLCPPRVHSGVFFSPLSSQDLMSAARSSHESLGPYNQTVVAQYRRSSISLNSLHYAINFKTPTLAYKAKNGPDGNDQILNHASSPSNPQVWLDFTHFPSGCKKE